MFENVRAGDVTLAPPSLKPTGPGAGAFTAGVVLAIALLFSILGSVITYREVDSAFARHSALDHANEQLRSVYGYQLDEETGLRGFLASGQRVFLQPYEDARPKIELALEALEKQLHDAGLTDAEPTLLDLRRAHALWEQQVAQPLLARPGSPDALAQLQRGKLLMDRMRFDFEGLLNIVQRHADSATVEGEALLQRASLLVAGLILLFGVAAIVADVVRTHTQAALERERTVADTLQRAFLSGWDILPYLRVGTAYVSSTRGAAVGGDLFDVHRIDEHRSALLVADVSGKGLQAAVETAQVKYSIRTFAEEYDDPGTILGRFNLSFLKASADPGAFISIFVGLLDEREMTLRYASAGHGPAYLRRGPQIEQLPVTGPLVGLMSTDEFQTRELPLEPGDLLVLATDGLTEARDASGISLGDAGAMRLIREGFDEPQELADELVSEVTRYVGGRIADDLALLIIKVAARADSPRVAREAGLEGGAAARVVVAGASGAPPSDLPS